MIMMVHSQIYNIYIYILQNTLQFHVPKGLEMISSKQMFGKEQIKCLCVQEYYVLNPHSEGSKDMAALPRLGVTF